jgi:hypothetical protein
LNGKTRTSPYVVPQLPSPAHVLKALLAQKLDPEVYLCLMIYAAVKRVCNSHWQAEAGQLLLEAYDETRLTLHQLVLTNMITKREMLECAVDIARKVTRRFMRSRREWQLPADGNDHSIALKTGGRMVDGKSGGHVVTSRADWRLAHEYEDVLIAWIDSKRVQLRAAEYDYERWVRLLGQRDADFILDYTWTRYDREHPSAERVRFHRLLKRLVKGEVCQHTKSFSKSATTPSPSHFDSMGGVM